MSLEQALSVQLGYWSIMEPPFENKDTRTLYLKDRQNRLHIKKNYANSPEHTHWSTSAYSATIWMARPPIAFLLLIKYLHKIFTGIQIDTIRAHY